MAALAIGNPFLRNREIKKFESLVKELDCYKDSKGKLFEAIREANSKKDPEFLELLAVVDEDLQNRSMANRSYEQSERSLSSRFLTEVNYSEFLSTGKAVTEERLSQRATTQATDSQQSNLLTLGNNKPTFGKDLRFVNRDLPVILPNKDLANLITEHCKVECCSPRSSV